MLFTGLMIVIEIYLVLFRRNYRRVEAEQFRNTVRLPLCLCTAALWLYDAKSGLSARLSGKGGKRKRQITAADAADGSRVGQIRAIGLSLIVIFCGLAMTLALQIIQTGRAPITEIARPDFGQETVVDAKVGEEEIAITVSGKDPDEEEMAVIFDRTWESNMPEILNGNASFSEIRGSLSCIDSAENGIRFFYESSDPQILSSYGLITAEEIPAEGLAVTYTVTLSYKQAEKAYVQEARILPAIEEDTFLSRLTKELERRNEESADRPFLILPASFEGQAVTFTDPGFSPWIILALFISAAAGILLLPKEQEKKMYEKRNDMLERTFPSLLMKLQLLIGAGLSIRSAFLKTAKDYEKDRDDGKTEPNAAYEEMLRTAHELETGGSETESYICFGRRCGLRRYAKLGNILARSVRQGIAGLEDTLREEIQSALEERKTKALRKGEEAGTRQIFPLILMLGIIIVMLMVPALLSF